MKRATNRAYPEPSKKRETKFLGTLISFKKEEDIGDRNARKDRKRDEGSRNGDGLILL
jgi:hypothetical protein